MTMNIIFHKEDRYQSNGQHPRFVGPRICVMLSSVECIIIGHPLQKILNNE